MSGHRRTLRDTICKTSLKMQSIFSEYFGKGLTEFCRKAAKEDQIIFYGGMYVGENTSRPTNVRA